MTLMTLMTTDEAVLSAMEAQVPLMTLDDLDDH